MPEEAFDDSNWKEKTFLWQCLLVELKFLKCVMIYTDAVDSVYVGWFQVYRLILV